MFFGFLNVNLTEKNNEVSYVKIVKNSTFFLFINQSGCSIHAD